MNRRLYVMSDFIKGYHFSFREIREKIIICKIVKVINK
jgi:hypothetical protein